MNKPIVMIISSPADTWYVTSIGKVFRVVEKDIIKKCWLVKVGDEVREVRDTDVQFVFEGDGIDA